MPSRNVLKTYLSENYYHAYNRGVDKQPIFLDARDKRQFIKIISRHLDPDNTDTKNNGLGYRKFNQDLELLCYCLMGNHFHLLFYIKGEASAMPTFMQSVLTAYTMYFNRRHKRVGTLFQGVFKASRITSDAYLMHITRYIHLNPRTYKTYYYSSVRQYLGAPPEKWLKPERIMALFDHSDYAEFLDDYEDYAATLETIKHELANTTRIS